MIINRFLAMRYWQSLGLVLAVVCAIILATSFMQEIGGAQSTLAALDSSVAHFLELFPMFLPLVAFLTTLLTFYKLTVSNELVIIQSCGLPGGRILRPMIRAAVFAGIVVAAVCPPLAARFGSGMRGIERIDGAVWLRDNQENLILRAKNIESLGAALIIKNATLIRLDAGHRIILRADCSEMILADGVIAAKTAEVMGRNGRTATIQDWTVKTTLDPIGIIRQHQKPNQVPVWELPRLIRNLEGMGTPTVSHELQFWSLLLLPFVLMTMTAMGAAFSRTKEMRQFSFARQFGIGIICCFCTYFVIQIFNAIGLSGAMPPMLAAFLPPAIVLFAAMAKMN